MGEFSFSLPFCFSIVTTFLQCSDTIGWSTGKASGLSQTGCWFASGDNQTGALHHLQLTTSIIISSNKVQNGDILPANPGPPGKVAIKMDCSFPTVTTHFGPSPLEVTRMTFVVGTALFILRSVFSQQHFDSNASYALLGFV